MGDLIDKKKLVEWLREKPLNFMAYADMADILEQGRFDAQPIPQTPSAPPVDLIDKKKLEAEITKYAKTNGEMAMLGDFVKMIKNVSAQPIPQTPKEESKSK